MSKIARFEALAEQLVEGTFSRLFGERLSPLEVATHLARAIEDHQALSPDGTPQAPTHYWVYLQPDDQKALVLEQPTLETELAHHVTELATQAGLELRKSPTVQVLANEGLPPHAVRVEARWIPDEMAQVEETREMEAGPLETETKAASETEAESPPPGRPFLVLEGRRHVDLLQPAVSIGRSVDNDVIIEDSRVSRHHAQLRQRYGHYVLYDLGSSRGTKINGYPVEECVLHAGDVISFGGAQVIYSEDPPTPLPLPVDEDTSPLPEESGENEPA